MANSYTQFSEVLPGLTEQEAQWLQGQIEPSLAGSGISYQFDKDEDADGWGQHLWLYAEESADLEQVTLFVQKFLQQFRPDQFWSLTFACTCDKPRVGAFGGGAVFVTAADIKWLDTAEFIEEEAKRFTARSDDSPVSETSPSPQEENGRYVLYDLDADELFSTLIYEDREEAVEDASQADGIIPVPFHAGRHRTPSVRSCEMPGHCYSLSLDGPLFRAQRELLLQLLESSQRPTLVDLRPEQGELLEGLIQLTEAIADQAADRYGIDCLL